MTYKTTVQLECSYGISEPWELQEATIEHENLIPYRVLYGLAVKAIGSYYTVYGAMCIIDERYNDNA